MRHPVTHRTGLVWLELLLALVFLVFILQLFPTCGRFLARTLDVRNWSRGTWFIVNLVGVAILAGIRLGPVFRSAWQGRRMRAAAESLKASRTKSRKEQRR